MGIDMELAAVPADNRANIARGMAAFERVMRTHGVCPFSMYRSQLGWIGFEWGREGSRPPDFQSAAQVREWLAAGNKPFNHGGGWSHIIAKRAWEGKWIAQYQGQDAEAIARFLIIAIAKGGISQTGGKAFIVYSGYRVVLERKQQPEAGLWLLSGYEIVTDRYQVITESAGDCGGNFPPLPCPSGHTASTRPACSGIPRQAVAADSVWSLAEALSPFKDFQSRPPQSAIFS